MILIFQFKVKIRQEGQKMETSMKCLFKTDTTLRILQYLTHVFMRRVLIRNLNTLLHTMYSASIITNIYIQISLREIIALSNYV